MTYGVTAADLALIQSRGFANWREDMLGLTINDSASETAIQMMYPRLSMTASQLGILTNDNVTLRNLGEATILRAINSKNQLNERMVEFWTDHFNITGETVGGWLLVPHIQTVIRPNALGSFKNLLTAVCKSPAMLVYLNNNENIGDFGNVNFARELLELHTMGTDGGYTQADVKAVARCFSGWTYRNIRGAPDYGTFVCWDSQHSNLAKTVLGVNIPAGGGVSDGQTVINILANHPSTALFIARKLARFLLQYDPPESVVNFAAREFLRTGGWIRAVVRAILTPDNLKVAKPKFKRPFHLMVGALRQLQAQVGDQGSLRGSHLIPAGHLPYTWDMPDGFPDQFEFWAGNLLPRWNFASMLPQNKVWNVIVNLPSLLGSAKTPDAVTIKIDQLLFAGEMLPADRANVLRYLKAKPINSRRIQGAFAIALASPSYQWY